MKNSINILKFFSFLIVAIIASAFVMNAFDLTNPLVGLVVDTPIGLAIVPFITLNHNADECNMAGTGTVFYVIKKEDIVSFPALLNDGTAEGTVTYTGNFVLKPGKYWSSMYSTRELGELKGETTGPRDGKYFNITGSWFYPSTSAKALGMAKLFKDAKCIIIAKEFSNGGQMRVIGSNELPADVMPSENVGKGFGDQKGVTFAFDAPSCSPALIYTGAVLLSDAIPTRLAANAATIAFVLGQTYVIGSNTSTIAILQAAITGMAVDDRIIIYYDALSTGGLKFTDYLLVEHTINATGHFLHIEKTNLGLIVIDQNVA